MTRGFSTIEIVLALMIISSAIAGVVLVTLGIPSAIADGHLRAVAVREADEILQKALRTGITQYAAVTSLATTTVNDYASSLAVISTGDNLTERLTSTVQWIDAKGRVEDISRTALMTDYRSATALGCSALNTGNWLSPTMTQYAMGPSFIPGNPAYRYPISSIAVSSTTLAVGIQSTNTKSEPDIFLFSIVDPMHPVYEDSVDTNSQQYAGPTSLAIQGTTLFAGNLYGANFASCGDDTQCSQMQAYDISNPHGPRKLYPYRLDTDRPPFASGSGGQSTDKTLLAQNGLLYMGLKKTGNTQGDEFDILDTSQGGMPIWLGGYAIGRTINQIIVSHGYAYLATDSPHNELVILDVHDPTHVTFVGDYDASGGTTFGYGEDIALAGNELALGRSFSSPDPGLYFLNVASTTPTVQSSKAIGDAFHPQNVDALALSRSFAFVLDDANLSLWNIADPANPTLYGSPIPLPGVANGPQGYSGVALACHGNVLYMASIDTINSGRLTALSGS